MKKAILFTITMCLALLIRACGTKTDGPASEFQPESTAEAETSDTDEISSEKSEETISSIAAAHGVSSAQVIIRWHLQAGNICIPGSSNEQHIIEDSDRDWKCSVSSVEKEVLNKWHKKRHRNVLF